MAYYLSKHLQEIATDHGTLLYHSKNGNNLVIHEGAVEVYHMLKAGDPLEKIRQEVEGDQLQEFLEHLIHKHFLVICGVLIAMNGYPMYGIKNGSWIGMWQKKPLIPS